MNDPRAHHGLMGSDLEECARLWRAGKNTAEIGVALNASEARVHNNMRHWMPLARAHRLRARREHKGNAANAATTPATEQIA